MKTVNTKPNVSKRVFATLFDYGVVWIFTIIFIRFFGEPNAEGGYTVSGAISLIPVLFWFIYIVLIESVFGASLGHAALGLTVKSIDFSKPSQIQIVKRRICDLIDIQAFFGLLAFILVKNTPNNQRLGDIWAKTIVVDTKDLEQVPIDIGF